MAGGDIFRFLTWSFTVPIVLFYVLSLVGCISNSPGIPDIYLLKMQDRLVGTEVRVGYFGMCAGTNTSVACQPSFSLDRASTNGTLYTNTSDPSLLRLVDMGHEVQTKVILFLPLMLASVMFFVSTFILVLWRNLPRMSPMAVTVSFIMSTLGLGLLLAAATAVSMVINALHFAVSSLTKGEEAEINITGGQTLQAFQWMTVIFSIAFQVCVFKRYRGEAGHTKM